MSPGPSSGGQQVIRVKTELVLEQLVSRVLGRALDLRPHEPPAASEPLLEAGPEPVELARLGYACRVAETELFEPARRPMPWLAEMLKKRTASTPQSIAELCQELASEEPDQKPDPGEGSWRVPGPGGHVRHFLALAAADEVVHGDSDGKPSASRELSAGEAKRCFLYGFYARCCKEAETPGSRTG
jgi:hypothetical protein